MANNIGWGSIYSVTNWGKGVINNISWGKVYANLAGAIPSFALDFTKIATDFTFTRNSFATRVNEQGLVETVTDLGAELITNGDFSNGSTGWNITNVGGLNGWRILDGRAICDTVNPLSGRNLNSTSLLTSGKTYKLTLDILQSVDGMTVLVGATSLAAKLPTGTNLGYEYIIDGSLHTGGAFVLYAGSSDLQEVDNVSVKEVLEDDVPRIDYSSGEGAFLLEPTSTNLLPYSEDFSQWITDSATTVSNSAISPSGVLNADKVIASAANTSHSIYVIPSVVSTSKYTFSLYAKADEYERLYVRQGTGLLPTASVYELSGNGSVLETYGNPQETSITSVGNGWYRITLTNTTSASSANFAPNIIGIPNSGYTASEDSVIFLGDGTSGVYIWGAQLEQLSYATSYIPTNGTTVTRAAELCVDATPTINSEEGVLYLDASALVNGGDNRYVSLSDGTTNNRLQLIYSNTASRLSVGGKNNAVSLTTINDISFDQTVNHKIAVAYSALGVKIFVDGAERDSNTDNASFPIGSLTDLDFSIWNSSSSPFYGNTKDLKIYDKLLTDDELVTLTTI